MRISVITATYNSVESVLDTQQSLAVQDLPRDRLEWIVVDGASTDGTVAKIATGGIQPDQLISEPDDGIYDALNKGVRMASGDVVGFLHGDDFLASPDALSSIARTFERSGADALYGDLQYVRPSEGEGHKIVRHWKSGRCSRSKLAWGWMPPHPTLYLKRHLYDEARLPNGEFFDTSFNCAADYDFMLRIFCQHNVAPEYLHTVLVKMLMGGVSNRSLKHILQKTKEDWTVIRRNKVGGIHTLAWKNLGKLQQFIMR